MGLLMVLKDRVKVPVSSLPEAELAFETFTEMYGVSARTFIPVPVIDTEARSVIGYFSMNGRFWTEDVIKAGNFPDDWDLMLTRFFRKHL